MPVLASGVGVVVVDRVWPLMSALNSGRQATSAAVLLSWFSCARKVS
jgi:hypothetical protein